MRSSRSWDCSLSVRRPQLSLMISGLVGQDRVQTGIVNLDLAVTAIEAELLVSDIEGSGEALNLGQLLRKACRQSSRG